jgi:hypothetical protein
VANPSANDVTAIRFVRRWIDLIRTSLVV